MIQITSKVIHDFSRISVAMQTLIMEEEKRHKDSIAYHERMQKKFSTLNTAIDKLFLDVGYDSKSKLTNKEEKDA